MPIMAFNGSESSFYLIPRGFNGTELALISPQLSRVRVGAMLTLPNISNVLFARILEFVYCDNIY